jgi:hypothetical protein
MPAPRRDWAAVVDRLIEGDALALLELSRLVNGFLSRLGAYDFRDEWDDVIQDVVLATARALSEGRIERREAVVGYLKSTTRFVFFHRLKRHLRCSEDETLCAFSELRPRPKTPVILARFNCRGYPLRARRFRLV